MRFLCAFYLFMTMPLAIDRWSVEIYYFNYFLHYSSFISKFKMFDFSLHEIIIGYITWIVILHDKKTQFHLVFDYFQFQEGWWQNYSRGCPSWRALNFSSFSLVYTHSAGNNILNPGSHRDQIIPLFDGHFKFREVRWYMPKSPVGQHGWETKKILQFRSSKKAFAAIFHNIILKNIAPFFF